MRVNSDALQWTDRSDAGKLSVTGPDAFDYLQAHLSADLRGVAVGAGSATALLTPRGQVRALARVLRFERGWLLHCERAALEGLFRGLWNGRIGWRVELHKLTLQQALVTVLGDDAVARLGLAQALGAGEHAHAAAALDGVPLRAVRSWAGVDLVARADHADALAAAIAARAGAGAAPLERCDWDWRRVIAGRLAYGVDVAETMLPAELALSPPLVATEKGLYPGMQTVLRQQRSGTVHRRICRLHAPVLLAPGDELLGGADGPSAGTITSGVCFDGLALVRLRGDGSAPLVHRPSGATVQARPLDSGAPSL
ncbi:YgfZ/GcvT domain-containing protein [Conexibacter woesei]|uniref:Glycine cleavage T protein (Aminomethyl transferase) n=1 Tax=Conexibacter woesei (strain DSM 14684 / CCUG 47730 / CIP 108061 / JCM 11494 / NBRC 100937 / ID131577) TaxID=469383 RepID=D3F1M2_CONWI|nr:glycine cleavage T protein (aminomethyl transferase) [Conexibacter woesei]ADB54053.1 glycine cleavage T protein (aminomethyl transferase) [Conexibacter woesei DSM 14684]